MIYDPPLSFTCPICHWVSYNTNDVKHRYCGHCHTFVDDFMIWYYKTRGDHTHVRVFMDGQLCGLLAFGIDDFDRVKKAMPPFVRFVDETAETAQRTS